MHLAMNKDEREEQIRKRAAFVMAAGQLAANPNGPPAGPGVPRTLEARILQDGDKLDAIGAIGVARCFHVGGRMGGALYHPDDPGAEARPLNDRAYALDHFPAKLFKVANGFLTDEGKRMAAARSATMRSFVTTFLSEVEGE